MPAGTSNLPVSLASPCGRAQRQRETAKRPQSARHVVHGVRCTRAHSENQSKWDHPAVHCWHRIAHIHPRHVDADAPVGGGGVPLHRRPCGERRERHAVLAAQLDDGHHIRCGPAPTMRQDDRGQGFRAHRAGEPRGCDDRACLRCPFLHADGFMCLRS